MIPEVLITCLCLYATRVTALPYENEYGPEYGNEWLWFYDDEGNTHVMNFSTIPNDTSRMVLGDAHYYLYTRLNAEPEELIVPIEDGQIFTSRYINRTNLIKVVTHGWLSNEKLSWLQDIKNEFLIKDNFNVITIDWSELSRNLIYPWAAFSTRYVGKKTAKLLDAIAIAYNIDGTAMHLLGHSLGSQVMAYTASFSKLRIQRITGLDPARPFFELPMMPQDFRLDQSDAEFVDIIHSCGGVYGYDQSHGHADFYPNKGRPRQPGCSGLQQVIEGCSHGRANTFFKESINSDIAFKAYVCESWDKFEKGECKENFTYMGYPASMEESGDYYLYTNSDPPYARGDEWNQGQ